MRQKIIAIGTALTLASLAIGAYAAQGGEKSSVAQIIVQTETPTETATNTATATDTETATSTATDTPTVTVTPAATATEVPTDTATPGPTETGTSQPEATETEGAGEGGRDIKGIPDSNPVHSPDDDGTCEPHETIEKTVPSGVHVVVPCHADHHSNNGHGNDHADQETND